MTPFKLMDATPLTEEQLTEIANATGQSIVDVRKVQEQELEFSLVFRNDTYQVMMKLMLMNKREWVWLSIKRIDRQPIHDWRDLQQIKNELVGEECEGLELYPAESRKVDTANQYHLWCKGDRRFRFPFGFGNRMVSDRETSQSRQRPLPEDAKVKALKAVRDWIIDGAVTSTEDREQWNVIQIIDAALNQ